MNEIIEAIDKLNDTMRDVRRELVILSIPEDSRRSQRHLFILDDRRMSGYVDAESQEFDDLTDKINEMLEKDKSLIRPGIV